MSAPRADRAQLVSSGNFEEPGRVADSLRYGIFIALVDTLSVKIFSITLRECSVTSKKLGDLLKGISISGIRSTTVGSVCEAALKAAHIHVINGCRG